MSPRFTEEAAETPGKAKWVASPKQEADHGVLTLNRGAAANLTGAHVVAQCGFSSGESCSVCAVEFSQEAALSERMTVSA